jgi:hypothetical protein
MMQMTNETEKQPDINDHSENQFSVMIQQGLSEGGIHLTASKGFGKSRLLFSMADSKKT